MATTPDHAPFDVFTSPQHTARNLPFVPAIRVTAQSDLIFVSGVLGTAGEVGADGAPVPPGDIRIEAERVFTRIQATLATAGAGLGDIVRITKYMLDLDQHDAVVAVMKRFFGDHLPTSTTIEVRRLVPRGFGLEVDAIAAVRARS